MKMSCHLWSTFSWKRLSSVSSVDGHNERQSWEPNCVWHSTRCNLSPTKMRTLAEASNDGGCSHAPGVFGVTLGERYFIIVRHFGSRIDEHLLVNNI